MSKGNYFTDHLIVRVNAKRGQVTVCGSWLEPASTACSRARPRPALGAGHALEGTPEFQAVLRVRGRIGSLVAADLQLQVCTTRWS